MSTDIKTITEMGNDLVEHCNSMTDHENPIAYDEKIWDKHFAESWVSVEADGQSFEGREAVKGKYQWWLDTFTTYGAKAIGPFVGPSGFSVIFEMDVEAKDGSFPRMTMQEVAVYTVEDGKITREEFRSPPMPGS